MIRNRGKYHYNCPKAGLEITAGQRTMSELIWELTGQPFILLVTLTGHLIVSRDSLEIISSPARVILNQYMTILLFSKIHQLSFSLKISPLFVEG